MFCLEPVALLSSEDINFLKEERIYISKPKTVIGRDSLIKNEKKCSKSQLVFYFDKQKGTLQVSSNSVNPSFILSNNQMRKVSEERTSLVCGDYISLLLDKMWLRVGKIEKVTFPNEIIRHILSFTHPKDQIKNYLLVCKDWFNCIRDPKYAEMELWPSLKEEKQLIKEGNDFLCNEDLSMYCRLDQLCSSVSVEGSFSSKGRRALPEKEQNHDYYLLTNLVIFLHDLYEMVKNAKTDGKLNGLHYPALVLGAHSEDSIHPIILKIDCKHELVPYTPKSPNPYEDESWNPFLEDENQGSIAYQTLKKMFRFPDEFDFKDNHDNKLEETLESMWEKLLADPNLDKYEGAEKDYYTFELKSFYERWFSKEECHIYQRVYKKVKERMEQYLEDVRILQFSNFASEEVSLIFILGVKGCYLCGFWFFKERDS